jgi:hypothetical protein
MDYYAAPVKALTVIAARFSGEGNGIIGERCERTVNFALPAAIDGGAI